MMTHRELKAKALSNPKVRQIYERPDPEMEMLDVFLKARKISGLTQEEIARRMKTSRPVVARIEAGGTKHSPSLNTLLKYAAAVGCRLKIDLVPTYSGVHSLRAQSKLLLKVSEAKTEYGGQ